jgi:hypothetical protein
MPNPNEVAPVPYPHLTIEARKKIEDAINDAPRAADVPTPSDSPAAAQYDDSREGRAMAT